MTSLSDHVAVRHFGGVPGLAEILGLTRQTLYWRFREGRPVLTADECLTLEEATGGALSRSALRPDLWPPIAAPEPAQAPSE